MGKKYVIEEGNSFLLIECPNCSDSIIVEKKELNCCIFRHGINKSSGLQIGPHSAKVDCDNLFSNGLIYGCGKPFRIVPNSDTSYDVDICDYI